MRREIFIIYIYAIIALIVLSVVAYQSGNNKIVIIWSGLSAMGVLIIIVLIVNVLSRSRDCK